MQVFFAVHETGEESLRNLQAARKRYFSDFIHVTMQEVHQGKCETHVLLFTSINYESKHVSDQNVACLQLPQSYVHGLFTNYKSPQQ